MDQSLLHISQYHIWHFGGVNTHLPAMLVFMKVPRAGLTHNLVKHPEIVDSMLVIHLSPNGAYWAYYIYSLCLIIFHLSVRYL